MKQDTKHKTFATPELATEWINAQPPGTHVIASASHADHQVIYYREPGDTREQQLSALKRRIEEHINYPEETRKKLGYYHTTVSLPAAQLSLVWNGIRNLKCFENSGTLKEDLPEMVEALGYAISDPIRSLSEYGCRAALILRK